MRDEQDPSTQGPEVTRLMPARAENARALYVINLSSSHTPMPLEMPDVRGFFGLAVFRSRRIEDGRERYRLHLGYFESRADAERALPAVQRSYPTAWIAAAPRSGLGSLDDTNVSEFRLIRTPPDPVQPDLATAPPVPIAKPGELPVAAPQRYVVQLVWSDQRVDPNRIPQLAIYDAYTMYTVTVMRSGVRYYGIRLGFFTSVISARQIALYVRPDFPSVAVVPVSSREFDVARTIAWHRDARTGLHVEPEPRPATPDTAANSLPNPPLATPSPMLATPPVPPVEARAEPEPTPASVLEPVRVVAARLVESTPRAASPAPEPPKPAAIVIPERPSEPARTPASQVKSATTQMREEAQRRGPAFSREELLEALRAKDAPTEDAGVESDTHYPPMSAHKRESAIRRLWHRLIG
ncbi:MAG TPA: hypothetical protein VLD59_11950 [Steroidobacteraceae bacterium]|nr:hypothetical protein [Steroidobacteraceae bacterium]